MDEQQQGEQGIDFFISSRSTGKDQAWAEWIAWELEQAGYRVHFQGWDVHPRSNVVKAMGDAAMCAECALLMQGFKSQHAHLSSSTQMPRVRI
ncbi:hypothetical protein KSF_088320 [Reticulibacter mediterranei]|uniref:TIR domain-containing protein n=1 Tax=Reticulibacter mediterranei TaxID=2778369 RepID=A0A8J3N570_9CHLR|nr:toll/interleukin-1 receptor domain-containing protein [Reticulibacter mediterranei]GHO98784.1 hypothetical protein KSF_088320 [Reticulibacter mediterranei]